MKLTRSSDRKIFSLTSFEPRNPRGEYFFIKAWYSMLKPFPISDALLTGINKFYEEIKQFFYELVEIKFVGNCNYV